MSNSHSVEHFFDTLSAEYAGAISRCVPRYQEMLWALVDYLPPQNPGGSILELGCGTGNLSTILADKFSEATIRYVDISKDSLLTCQSRLGTDKRFIFEQADFRDLAYPPGSFDLVISSISVHHLTPAEKCNLFQRSRSWLTERGIFAYSDQFAGATSDLYQRHMQHWREQARQLGASDEDWNMWMDHQSRCDHHDSLPDQMRWLTDAGFATVDCVWRYLLWTVIQASR